MIALNKRDVEDAVNEMCAAAQLPVEAAMDDTYKHQVIAFILALNKNYEREQRYKGLWRDDTLEEIGQHVIHKGKRMAAHDRSGDLTLSAVGPFDDATDDALDIINYGAFCARKVHYAAIEAGLELTS